LLENALNRALKWSREFYEKCRQFKRLSSDQSELRLILLFDAFSLREPVSTSLENAFGRRRLTSSG
jgi:hypothetical protein